MNELHGIVYVYLDFMLKRFNDFFGTFIYLISDCFDCWSLVQKFLILFHFPEGVQLQVLQLDF